MNVELVEDLCRNVVIVAEQREEKVFRADDIRLVQFRLEIGDLQDLFGLFCERDIADGQRSTGSPDRVFYGLLQLDKDPHPGS